MTLGVTGSSGLIGSALCSLLIAQGHRVVRLRRTNEREIAIPEIADGAQQRFDAIVHLAGEPIASGRWTTAKKTRIRASRVEGTRSLCQRLAEWEQPPKVLVCASAIGYYGDRGDERLDEQSPPGVGFLPEVVQAWEETTRVATQRGIRVVCLRLGMVLSPDGGALAAMLRPFQLGLGGRIGTGRQYWSWIAIDDAIGAIVHALKTDSLVGPVNAVAPEPPINDEFVAALGRVLRRPTVAATPAWLARTLFGEMAEALLLASARVVPRRLLETGYAFQFGELDPALRHLLQRDGVE